VALSDIVYYQPLLSKAEHLGLTVKYGLLYSASGLLYTPVGGTIRATLMQEVHDALLLVVTSVEKRLMLD
jgi:hypothetical protein